MRGVLGASFALALLLLAHPARAVEQTLVYRAVVHVAEERSLDVPGQPGHEIGVAAFRGLALFDNGEVAAYRYTGGFDFVAGGGTFQGYADWSFDDGSAIHARYTGVAAPATGGGITFTGQHVVLTGEGRFVGMQGSGSFEGRRIDGFSDGGDTYHMGELQLGPGG